MSCQKLAGKGVRGNLLEMGLEAEPGCGAWVVSPPTCGFLRAVGQWKGFEHGEVGCVCILESSFRGRGGCREWRGVSGQ